MPLTLMGIEVEYCQTGKSPGAFFGVEVETTLGGGAQIVGSPIVHPVGRTSV